MNYKNKIRLRIGLAACYLVIGLLLILFQGKTDADFFSGFGLALAVIGLCKILQNLRYLFAPEKLLAVQTAETDERNVMIYTKARSTTYVVFSLLCAAAILLLRFLGYIIASQTVAYMLCAIIAINTVCFLIYSRKY